jgi:hypothetical protein
MPFQCKECKKQFEIDFHNPDQARKFQKILLDHIEKEHKGLTPEFHLVDENGISINESRSEQVLYEEKLLDNFSQWVN